MISQTPGVHIADNVIVAPFVVVIFFILALFATTEPIDGVVVHVSPDAVVHDVIVQPENT